MAGKTSLDPAEILKVLGYEQEPVSWQTNERERIPVARFGKDHWSTFAYVETRVVDHKGMLNFDQLRVASTSHPVLVGAGKRAQAVGGSDGARYPTRLKDGEVANHDDLDCLDDLVAAGYLTVTMPPAKDGHFVTAFDRAIRECREIDPGFVTGLSEARLMEYASWSLTELGQQVAGQLRAHKGNGGNFATFTPEVPDA